jgi:hypothetical protein
MANYKTGAQRYNDRMDKIMQRARDNGTIKPDARPCPVCGELTALDAPSMHCIPL